MALYPVKKDEKKDELTALEFYRNLRIDTVNTIHVHTHKNNQTLKQFPYKYLRGKNPKRAAILTARTTYSRLPTINNLLSTGGNNCMCLWFWKRCFISLVLERRSYWTGLIKWRMLCLFWTLYWLCSQQNKACKNCMLNTFWVRFILQADKLILLLCGMMKTSLKHGSWHAACCCFRIFSVTIWRSIPL